mgnify:CR=1 FL=1
MKIYYVLLLKQKIIDVSAKYGNDEYLWIDNFLSYIRKNDYRNEFLIVKVLYKNILNLNDDMKAFEISSKDKVKYFIARYPSEGFKSLKYGFNKFILSFFPIHSTRYL